MVGKDSEDKKGSHLNIWCWKERARQRLLGWNILGALKGQCGWCPVWEVWEMRLEEDAVTRSPGPLKARLKFDIFSSWGQHKDTMKYLSQSLEYTFSKHWLEFQILINSYTLTPYRDDLLHPEFSCKFVVHFIVSLVSSYLLILKCQHRISYSDSTC